MRVPRFLSFSPIAFFRKHKRLSTSISVMLSIAIINLTWSCSYYKVNEVTSEQAEMAKQIDDFNKMGRYAIMHVDDFSWHLTKLVVNEDKQVLTGEAMEISPQHTYKKKRKSGGNRYMKWNQPMDEIHFQLIPGTVVPEFGETVEIPFSRISSISINKPDGGTSVAYASLAIVGVLAGIFIIILATKSSCPFVYVKDGNTYNFNGELYPGVLSANMERDDFLQLDIKNKELSEIEIRVTNELKEIQHTDLLELMILEEIDDAEVLLDKYGKPLTFSALETPTKVFEDGLNLNLEPGLNKDKLVYHFNSLENDYANKRHLIAEFDYNEISDQGKLYLTAKNSLWLDYLYGKFNSLFGTYYPTFQKNQQQTSLEKSQTWMDDQHIPLSIYVKNLDGWKFVDKINPVGPLAFRNLAIPIDLGDCPPGPVQVKLETGFMFWEVDYMGIDFSENLPVDIHYIQPSYAVDETGKNVTKLLKGQDRLYLTQPEIGNSVDVTFDLGDLNISGIGSVFLKNRGYYTYIRNYTNEPEFDKLKVFRDDESFTEFSRLEYQNLVDFADQEDLALSHDQ
ncbi:MAG: hypothetical protein KJO49_08025 [Bacteroidia bacterium]|nr:hypothetical protein [Bacteroidia bacterium]